MSSLQMKFQAGKGRFVDVLLTALAPIIWGTTYIVTTECLPADKPLFAAVSRILPAGLLLTLYSRKLPAWSAFWPLFWLSLLNIAAFQSLLFVAAYRLPGGIAAVIGSIQPLFIMLLLMIFDASRPKLSTLLASLAAIIGMAMLLLKPDSKWDALGVGAAFLGALSMGAGIYLTKRWRPAASILTYTGWQLLLGGLLLLPLAWVIEAPPVSLSLKALLGYIYLSLLGALLAYVLWFRGIQKLPVVAVSILGALSPITATMLGWILLGQTMSALQMLGFLILLIAIYIVQIKTKEAKS